VTANVTNFVRDSQSRSHRLVSFVTSNFLLCIRSVTYDPNNHWFVTSGVTGVLELTGEVVWPILTLSMLRSRYLV
jgi:hypothetical protein